MLEHASRCSAQPCLARSGRVERGLWFGTCLLLWVARPTMLVFGTRPCLPVFAPAHPLGQSHSLPSYPGSRPATVSSSSTKRPLSVLGKDRNIDVISASRSPLSPTAPFPVSMLA
ncbi:hypothetical protein GY45DRAFT_149954 [Cubamyces sp. BRFM 1775]|nr:hypothetical protein GY45DRAFT_149954 [Cubamyces sp. BRFM 1775]